MKKECLICKAPLEYLHRQAPGRTRCVQGHYVCDHSRKNNRCIGKRCPFSEVHHEKA